MLDINGTGGLCMTCNNAPTCYYHATRGPALFCELFDNYVPSSDRFVPSGDRKLDYEALPSDTSPVRTLPDEREYKGLCMNCEHREECPPSKTAAGVWHCEEYE
jgi:hypothetical protein